MINQRAITISAMELRKEPGRFLDQVYYQGQRFIVERAGEPKAVMVPMREFEQMERNKQTARVRLTQLTEQARRNVTQSGVSEEQLKQEIDAAIEAVRAEQRTSPSETSHASHH